MQDNEAANYIKQAFDLKEQGSYKHAIEMLYKALSEANDNLEILFQLGELYVLLHNYDRALQYLERVLARDKNHLSALKCVKDIYVLKNDYKEAEKYAKTIFELEKTPQNLSSLIKVYGKLNKLDEIKAFKNSELITDVVLLECAITCFEHGDCQIAKDIISDILKNEADNEEALILLGKIYFNENEFQKSKEIFGRFSKNTENPEVLNYMGLFALDDMRVVDAVKCFSKASNLDKNNSKYFFNLANAYFINGWIEESTKAYLKAICLEPENLDYRYALAYLYYETKVFDKAQKEVDFILERSKNHSQAVVLNALLKMNKKDLLGAQKDLENNLSADSEDNFTLISLGKVYKELSMYEKAAAAINKVIEKSPENLNYLCELSEVYLKEKVYDKALELVEKVISINERFIAGFVLGAKISFEKGDFEAAKNYAQNALALDINCSEGYFYLAQVRYETNDFEEAVECMKRAILYDPANPKYYAGMSELYKRNGDIKTALDYIREAESIDSAEEYKIMYRDLASLNRKSKKDLSSK